MFTPPGGRRGSTSVSCGSSSSSSLVVREGRALDVLLPLADSVSPAEPDALEAGEAVRVGLDDSELAGKLLVEASGWVWMQSSRTV